MSKIQRLQKFLDVYKANLAKAHAAKPEEYTWSIDQLDEVYGRMVYAITKGTFNKDSESFKWTCKELGIKHTYKAIQEFING